MFPYLGFYPFMGQFTTGGCLLGFSGKAKSPNFGKMIMSDNDSIPHLVTVFYIYIKYKIPSLTPFFFISKREKE